MVGLKKWTKTRPARLSKKPVVTGWVTGVASGVAKSSRGYMAKRCKKKM